MFPDPILRKKCRTVRRVDDKVRELVADMVDTMDEVLKIALVEPFSPIISSAQDESSIDAATDDRVTH